MPNYFLAYHGGKPPETEMEEHEVMDRWVAWMERIAPNMVDDGNPVGLSKTVTAKGVVDNGGSNPLSGYSIVRADSMEEAISLTKGCPMLDDGSIEVAEIIEIGM